MPRPTPSRRATTMLATAVLLSLALLAGACGSNGSNDSGSGSTGTTTGSATGDDAVGAAPAYEKAGPYVPGVTTLDLDGRKVEVWYPADPGAEAGKAKD